jgi:hypothetical protein
MLQRPVFQLHLQGWDTNSTLSNGACPEGGALFAYAAICYKAVSYQLPAIGQAERPAVSSSG